MPSQPLRLLRPALGSALCLAAAAVWVARVVEREHPFLLVPAATLVIAAALVHARPVGAQMLARGVMWAMLLLGALLAQLEGPRQSVLVGPAIAACCGGALLLLGGRGLDGDSARFRPVAFRGTLTAALTLAMADTLSLAFWAMAAMDGKELGVGLGLLGCAALMAVGIVGLYRLRTWGLAVNLAANLLIAALVGSGALDTPGFLSALLIATAVVQLIVPAPLLVALVRRRPPRVSAARTRAGWIVSAAAVVLVVALAVQPLWGVPLIGRHFP